MDDKSTIEAQRKFYDSRWRQHGFANRAKLMRCVGILEALVSLRLDEPRILDLGAGSGWMAGILGNFGPTTAVELSVVAVEQAAKRYPYVQFIASDIMSWDYPSTFFDVVVSQEVIEHVEDQKKYLSVAHGSLRRGGYLILTTPNARTFYAMARSVRASWSNQPLENLLMPAELKALLVPQFELLRFSTVISGHGSSGIYRYVNSTRLKRLFERCGLFPVFDRCRLAAGFGLHSVVIATKR
jgi:2-polyprenyl-3-methyl-5-hydroxy-6-metoxy-1,4-benzoquinol methylase